MQQECQSKNCQTSSKILSGNTQETVSLKMEKSPIKLSTSTGTGTKNTHTLSHGTSMKGRGCKTGRQTGSNTNNTLSTGHTTQNLDPTHLSLEVNGGVSGLGTVSMLGKRKRITTTISKGRGKRSKEEGGEFRLQGKRLFLTYAQCTGHSKEELKKFLDGKLDYMTSHIVAKELHEDGNEHFHVYWEGSKRYNIRRADYLDWNIGGETYHPKMEKVKSATKVQRYCTKEDDYITNMEFNVDQRANELAKEGKINEALKYVIEHRPGATNQLERLKAGYNIIANLHKTTTLQYTKEQFHEMNLENWNRQRKSLVIMGKPGWGKTQWAITCLFKNPLIVRHMDKLKQFDPFSNDGIIFDDMNFSHYPRSARIHLLDVEVDTDINVKCSMVTIPAGTPRVFTTNETLRGVFYNEENDTFRWPDFAITRRICSIKITGTLIKGGPSPQLRSAYDAISQSRAQMQYENNQIISPLEGEEF